jgi:RNA polymerase sigma factor (sigma-70 family)
MFNRDKLNQLYQYGNALTGQEELAYDLVHDAVEKLISKTFVLNKFAYAKKIMRNKYFDILKSKAHSTSTTFEDDIPSLEDMDEKIDNYEEVKTLLNKLGTMDREILYLWSVEEYTTQEISDHFGIAKGTITSKIKRLRDKLQKEEIKNG